MGEGQKEMFFGRGRRLSGLLVATCLGIVTALGGCGGGGSDPGIVGDGGVVSALSLPDRITLANNDSGAGAIPAAMRAFSDGGTDYALEPKESWVDDGIEQLEIVNDILGVVQDSGYENFLNAGPYLSMVRVVGGDGGGNQGGSSSGANTTTEELLEMVVDASRASATAPMIVKIWMVEPAGERDPAKLIRGYFSVSEGVSAQYPYGKFEAHFMAMMLDAGGNEVGVDPMFTAAMSIGANTQGQVTVQFVESSVFNDGFCGLGTHQGGLNAITDGLTAGNAYVAKSETFEPGSPCSDQSEELHVGFDGNYFKVADVLGGGSVVYDKNTLLHKVYRYKLFNEETGAKVVRNSGFPITVNGDHAYIGYWGLWAPPGVDLQDGATITRADTKVDYTLVKAPGKLIKHSLKTIALGDLTGVEFYKGAGCGQNGCVDDVIVWTGAEFQKIGVRGESTNWQTDSNGIIPSTATFNQWDGAWCEALRAWLPLGNIVSPGDASIVNFHAEEVVNPASLNGDLTLYTWNWVPAATDLVSPTALQASRDAYWQNPTPSESILTFESAGLVLKNGPDAIALDQADPATLQGTEFQWGLRVDTLTTVPMANQGDAWNQAVYYSWETGPNDWNQFVTVKDGAGAYVEFDPPIKLDYTHASANDPNYDGVNPVPFDGKKFVFDYDGFELQIPWEYDAASEEWMPLLNLADGTVLSDGTTNYVVKGIGEELVMATALDSAFPADPTDIGAPTLVYNDAKTALVGALPASVELKVIKGEVIP